MSKTVFFLWTAMTLFLASRPAYPADTLSKQDLKDLQTKMSQRQDLALSFEQVRVSNLRPNKPSVSKGHALFQKPAKFRWETITPKPDVVAFDGVNLVNFKPGDMTATRYKADGDRAKEIREVIDFVMDFDSLLKRYKIVSSTKSASGIVLKMSPSVKDSAITSLDISLDAKEALVTGVKMTFQNKNTTEFRFSAPTFTQADRQMFGAPAGVKIIDGL
jgi:outer membrane lipoprotein-sorting protein